MLEWRREGVLELELLRLMRESLWKFAVDSFGHLMLR